MPTCGFLCIYAVCSLSFLDLWVAFYFLNPTCKFFNFYFSTFIFSSFSSGCRLYLLALLLFTLCPSFKFFCLCFSLNSSSKPVLYFTAVSPAVSCTFLCPSGEFFISECIFFFFSSESHHLFTHCKSFPFIF